MPYANLVDGLSDSGDEAAIRTKAAIIRISEQKGHNPKSATQAAILSQGDEFGRAPGSGVMSSSVTGTMPLMKGSAAKVKMEGKNVPYLIHETSAHSSSDSVPGMQVAPSQSKVIIMGG